MGIPSIIASSKVDSLYNLGKYEEAKAQAVKAKQWAKYAAITGAVIWIIYFIAIIAQSK